MKIKGCIAVLLLVVSAYSETNGVPRFSFPRWGPSIKAGSIYNFETDMEGGGSFAVNRYFIEAGIARMWSFDRMIAVSAGYGQDDYQFSDLGTQPWNNIDAYRLGLFARWRVSEGWILFAGRLCGHYACAVWASLMWVKMDGVLGDDYGGYLKRYRGFRNSRVMMADIAGS